MRKFLAFILIFISLFSGVGLLSFSLEPSKVLPEIMTRNLSFASNAFNIVNSHYPETLKNPLFQRDLKPNQGSLKLNKTESVILSPGFKTDKTDKTDKTYKDKTDKRDKRDIIRLPIVMYHKISDCQKGTYIVTQQQFENDLLAFNKAGYTTVFPSEIIEYVKNGKFLPKKPLLITFDDGHYNNMSYGLPLLKKYNAKALINIIGKFSNFSTTSGDHSNNNYSHLTWSQIKELSLSGHFEIGSHSYNMHNYKPRFGISQKNGESDEQYCNCLSDDVGLLQEKLEHFVGVKPKVFAYPFGEYSNLAKNLLKSLGFEMFLTCNEGVSNIKKFDINSIHQLKRINRSGYYTTQELLSKLSGETMH